MRLVLILVCLAALVSTAWLAASRGLDAPFFGGAARIEAVTAERVRQALGGPAAPVEVSVSGRDVVVLGQVPSAEARDRIVAAVAAVPLVRRVVNRIALLPLADPFRLVVTKSPGGLAISGNVPGRAAEQALLAEARAISPGGVDADLDHAGGAPEAWEEIARTGLQALAPLTEGRLELTGDAVAITGTAPDAGARAAALSAAEGAPGTWQADIRQPIAYAFTAMKTPDGAVIVGGSAPDAETRDALVGAAAKLTDLPVEGSIELAGGSPPPGWAGMVDRGIEALGRTADGLLTVTGTEVSLSGNVGSEEERAALMALLEPGWKSEIAIVEPGPPPPELALDYHSEGGLTANGLVPAGVQPETLAALLPGADLGRVRQSELGARADWESAVEALSIVLPRFRQAGARLRDGRLAMQGELKRGFSAGGTRATLLAALGSGWRLELDLTETEPLAELVFTRTGNSLALSGLLPARLDPGEAIALLGGGATGDGLAGGGAGDAADWSQIIDALGEIVGLFENARGRVADQEVVIAGVLRPGYAADAVAGRLAAAVPEGWTTSLDAEETPASEGDRRTGLDTGAPEVFRRGFWLPELDFPVSPERCATEADAALEGGQVRFVTGSANIDDAGLTLIDRLAAIAVRCLNSSEMRLEIAGHTDSVGNDARNQALSEARAAAVRDALVERGVRAESLTASGYGESQPIDSNDTAEGRARNRRIAFNWSES